VLRVEIVGSAISVSASDATTRGLAIHRGGISFNNGAFSNNKVEGRLIGTDVTGTTRIGGGFGTQVLVTGARIRRRPARTASSAAPVQERATSCGARPSTKASFSAAAATSRTAISSGRTSRARSTSEIRALWGIPSTLSRISALLRVLDESPRDFPGTVASRPLEKAKEEENELELHGAAAPIPAASATSDTVGRRPLSISSPWPR
jgi:hypothetical protein